VGCGHRPAPRAALARRPNEGASSTPLAFSPDGEFLAVGGRNDAVWLFDVASHAKVATLTASTLNSGYGGVAFSPDGRILAATSSSGTFLWHTATRKLIGRALSGIGNGLMSMAFSSDGRSWPLATAITSSSGTSGTGGRPESRSSTTNSSDNTVSSVAFSANSRTLAVGTLGGTVQMYMVPTGQRIGEPLTISADTGVAATAMAFDPRGRFLAVGSKDGHVRIWNVSYLTDVASRLCAAAGRSLTHAEWARYVHGLAYENVCP